MSMRQAQQTELSSIEEILDEARAGRMFILVDDEDRENEGDLVMPAQFAHADAINFMAKYGRGLICLALDSHRVRELGLPPMARHNASRHSTAFTVSIEAREGITTGISAADRALTIAVAINPERKPRDIVSPGHVFPLEARDGGVLVRAGHTEAAVDISRLAGLAPSGVICEIMNDDGTMARMNDLIAFAKLHQLKIATIADLIAYRRKSEKLVTRLIETPLHTTYGDFTCIVYATKLGYAEHIALIKGTINSNTPTLVRMHAHDVLQDALGDMYHFTSTNKKTSMLDACLKLIAQSEQGVLVLLREPNKSAVSDRLSARINAQHRENTLRDYGIGAQILLDLGVTSMSLLTNSPKSIVGLDGYGLEVRNHIPVETP